MPDDNTDQPHGNRTESITLRFSDMAYGGEAVGRDPATGMAVFAWPAIEGEEATVVVTGRRKNLLRGLIAEVRSPSPLRVTPPCPYFGRCGGCQWQHIEYSGQAGFKHHILRAQLQRIGGLPDPDPLLRPPVVSPRDFHYRNTSHFAIEPASLRLGYFKRESHQIIAVESCPISNEGINRAIPLVNMLIARCVWTGIETPDMEHKGIMQVWKVAVRASERTGHLAVVLHSRPGGRAVALTGARTGRPPAAHPDGRPDSGPGPDEGHQPGANPIISIRRRDVRKALQALARTGTGTGTGTGPEPPITVVEVMDDGTVNLLGETRAASLVTSEAMADLLAGEPLKSRAKDEEQAAPVRHGPPLGAWVERLAGRTFWVAPDSFFQVNTQAADLLLAEVAEHVPPGVDLLVDAHAGVGTFAIALADRAKRVVGFEVDGAAVHSSRWNALANNVAHADFRRGRAEDLMARLPAGERPDLVLLDPPRSGCHPSLLAEIIRRQVPRIVYVSCDPGTLARDIKILATAYDLVSARVVDLFPQTYHIETVAMLERRP